MRHYVCGFLFTPDRQQVALIVKARPKWQAGLRNGIGGKWEEGENGLQAMRREFREETGADVSSWKPFCTLLHSVESSKSSPAGPWTVHFYKAFEVATLQSPTDEQVNWFYCHNVRGNIYFVPNLQWLIPMALEDLTAEIQQHNWPHEQ